VGTLATTSGTGLHSRIIEGVTGTDGSDGSMLIIDPSGGRRYSESFSTLIRKYKGALSRISTNGQYLQIRYFG